MAVGGDAVWLAVHYPDQIRSIYQIEVGTDPEWQRKLREHYVAASPFMGVTHHLDAGDIVAVGDVIDYAEFLEGRFYQEWAAPQGWPDIIMAVAAKERDRFSWLGICLSGRATADQKKMVAALLPHVARSLRISDLLEMREAEAADLAAAVESLSSGMLLVDAELELRGINPGCAEDGSARPSDSRSRRAGCMCPVRAPAPSWPRPSPPAPAASSTGRAPRSCSTAWTASSG